MWSVMKQSLPRRRFAHLDSRPHMDVEALHWDLILLMTLGNAFLEASD